MSKHKIAVAYSGGLDTSVMVRWLKERYDADIIAVTGNIGDNKELSTVRQKALKTGAKKAIVIDGQKEFITDFCFPALRAGAMYEGAYPMATSLGRPLLARMLVETALREGCDSIAHGCTGKGNDQVRFEVVASTLAPNLAVLAPLRDPAWPFKSREEEITYAQKHKIPVIVSKKSPYSLDANLYGVSIECGVLEDPMCAPPEDAYQMTSNPHTAPAKGATVKISFVKGTPVALNGKATAPVELVKQLNVIAGANGVGRIDLVENRLVGIKSREIYEAPAGIVLHTAHRELERLTLDRATMRQKEHIAPEYADLVYNGLWFTPLREAYDAFVSATQRTVTGDVVLSLRRGVVRVEGRNSPYSLYDMKLATYTAEDSFRHSAAEGFIHIFGLQAKGAWQASRRAAKKS